MRFLLHALVAVVLNMPGAAIALPTLSGSYTYQELAICPVDRNFFMGSGTITFAPETGTFKVSSDIIQSKLGNSPYFEKNVTVDGFFQILSQTEMRFYSETARVDFGRIRKDGVAASAIIQFIDHGRNCAEQVSLARQEQS